MKRMSQWMLAAILVCGVGVFTSCTSNVELDELPAEQGLDYAGPATSNRLVGRGGCFENAPTSCTVGFHGREIIGLQQAPTTTVGFRLILGVLLS